MPAEDLLGMNPLTAHITRRDYLHSLTKLKMKKEERNIKLTNENLIL